jgi:hypothetical protein
LRLPERLWWRELSERGSHVAQNFLILIEVSKLCPSLLERGVATGKMPDLKRVHDGSEVCVAEADAKALALSPTIQWYSLHPEIGDAAHPVFRLAHGPLKRCDDLWIRLRGAGLKTFDCGIMNTARYDDTGRCARARMSAITRRWSPPFGLRLGTVLDILKQRWLDGPMEPSLAAG